MDVTAIQPVRLQEIVAIPGSTRREGFAVAANQTLDGQVVSVEGDTLIVSIGQQRVPAQANPGTTLRPGEAIRLFVRDVDPDQVVMQIVARGSSMQTLRSLTTQDLRAELTGLGVTPDDQAVEIARSLINRGLPVTAQNVLEVRTGLARLGQGAAAPDLEAAVFLKGQGLPITADGVQIVRQALQSRSALGAQIEGLRTALADLAFRLTAQGVEPAPRGPVVTITPAAAPAAAPEASAAPDGAPAAAPTDGAARPAAPAPPPASAPRGPVATADAEAYAAPTDRPPQPVAAATRGTAADRPAQPAAAGAPDAPEPAMPGQPGATSPVTSRLPAEAARPPADAASQTAAAPTPDGEVPPSPAARAELPRQTGEDAPPAPAGEPEGLAPRRTASQIPSGGAGAEPPGPAPSRPAGAAPTGTPPAPTPVQSEPSLPRLLGAVAELLDKLPLLDDHAVEQGADQLAREIRRVIADHGTPVEAKLARVLEGLAGRADVDRLLAGDLKSSLQALVQETQAQLRAPERLPPETVRDLQAAGRQAEALLGQVELQQLANAAPRTDGQQPAYLVFQLPIPGGREPQTAQIRIRQEADGKTARIDPQNVHLVFQLELQNLQTVRVGIRVVGKHLSCQMGSSDPAATELLAEHAPELRQGLAGLGYVVDPIQTALLTPEDVAPTAPAPRPAMRVDARA